VKFGKDGAISPLSFRGLFAKNVRAIFSRQAIGLSLFYLT
jgi:hypothetical protein